MSREGRFTEGESVRVNRKSHKRTGEVGEVFEKTNPPGNEQGYGVRFPDGENHFWDSQLDPQ